MRSTRIFTTLGFGLLCLVAPVQTGGAVPDTMKLGYSTSGTIPGKNSHPHNLSNISEGAIHATALETDQICIFCHTPHGSTPAASPLWNRQDPQGGPFPLYGDLGTLQIDNIPAANYTTVGYPNGATRMCMSCHDGTTAIGTVLNGTSGTNIAPSLTSMTANGTVNLATSHPVSFVYDGTVQTALGASFQLPPAGWRDSQNRMQCTTCHDPHTDTKGGTYNLPMWAKYSGVENTDYTTTCDACHVGWSTGFPGDLGDGHSGNFPALP